MNHSVNRFKSTSNLVHLLGVGFEFLFILMLLSAGGGCSDSCDDVTCYNGGICVDGDCFCPEGWTGADCSTPTSNSTPCEPVEFNGHTYEVVAIGTQCWFAENLRSDQYLNGDDIPGDLSNSEWAGTSSGAQAIPAIFPYLDAYGRLYNWYAVEDSRGLCPEGWHVPSDSEWMTLEMELGMGSAAANATGMRGTDQGEQLKSSSFDVPAWNGSNSSGFSGLSAGFRFGEGIYSTGGGNWWSSTPYDSDAWYRFVYGSADGVSRNAEDQRCGRSVRCVRD